MKSEASSVNALSEQVSALVDGHLDAAAGTQVLGHMGADASLRDDWHLYQVIGDVLRNPAMAPTKSELDFLDRLRPALEQEARQSRQTLMAGTASFETAASPEATLIAPVNYETKPAANAPVFRWKLLAGVAVFALTLGVFLGEYQTGSGAQPQLANTAVEAVQTASQLAADEPGNAVMIRDPELDALLAAHQQMGGSTALQKPSGFLRNATFERSGR